MQSETLNLNFNTEVEISSLKDSVWRLTTRVFLLEDIINKKFGEVLGPCGYSKIVAEPVNQTKVDKPVIIVPDENLPSGAIKSRKRRSSRCKTRSSLVNKSLKLVKADEDDSLSSTEFFIIPKEEILSGGSDDENEALRFFGDDDSGDENDNAKDDPDFSLEELQELEDPNPRVKVNKRDKEKVVKPRISTVNGRPIRGPGALWVFSRKYDNQDIAKTELAKENWKVESHKKQKTGQKVYFCCQHSKCPSKRYIHREWSKTEVSVFTNCREHENHDDELLKKCKINPKVRDRIIELYTSEMKPKSIASVLQDEFTGKDKPSLTQVNNMIRYYIKLVTSRVPESVHE